MILLCNVYLASIVSDSFPIV